ncbi:MAG: protein kinase domain-containing protein [Gammaproteobacteria bacterium]
MTTQRLATFLPRQESKKTSIKPLSFKTVPQHVQLSHLTKDFSLLTPEEYKATCKLSDPICGDYRFRKKELNSAYGQLRLNNRHHVIYKGKGKNPTISKFSLASPIAGFGTYGTVKYAYDHDSLQKIWYALKVQAYSPISQNEYQILKKLKRTAGQVLRFSTQKNMLRHNILMDLAPGIDLSVLVNQPSFLSPIRWINIVINMLLEVQNIHANGILHCDIKPENFIINLFTDTATLVDFGFAIESETLSVKNAIKQGSINYVAPEVFKGIYNVKTEIFALGKTIAATLGLTYHTKDKYLVLVDDDHPKFESNRKIPDPHLRLSILNFLQSMAAEDPDERPNFDKILDFFKQIQKNLLTLPIANIGIFDLAEYDQLVDKTQKEKFLDALQSIDEVILVDTCKELDEFHYLEIKLELEKRQINIINKIFYAPEEKPHHIIADIPDHLAQDNPAKRYYFYFTAQKADEITDHLTKRSIQTIIYDDKKTLQNYKNEILTYIRTDTTILPAHREALIHQLENELSRLNTKYSDDNPKIKQRKKNLRETITLFKDTTYATAKTQLEKITDEIEHESPFKDGLTKKGLFLFSIKGQKKLKDIKLMLEAQELALIQYTSPRL